MHITRYNYAIYVYYVDSSVIFKQVSLPIATLAFPQIEISSPQMFLFKKVKYLLFSLMSASVKTDCQALLPIFLTQQMWDGTENVHFQNDPILTSSWSRNHTENCSRSNLEATPLS